MPLPVVLRYISLDKMVKILSNGLMKNKISMTQNQKEIVTGAVIFILFLGFLGFIHMQEGIGRHKSTFSLYATFAGSDGLMKGNAVRLGGLSVGSVTDMTLTDGYRVRVQLSFNQPFELSADTSAVIETDGLMGPKHIELIPGGEEELLENGDEILYTQDAVVLNDLLAKVNLMMQDKKNKQVLKKDGTSGEINNEKESD